MVNHLFLWVKSNVINHHPPTPGHLHLVLERSDAQLAQQHSARGSDPLTSLSAKAVVPGHGEGLRLPRFKLFRFSWLACFLFLLANKLSHPNVTGF